MVSILAGFSGTQGTSTLGWVLVGAIPSCVIWPLVAARTGEIYTAAFLLALLALAILLVVAWSSHLGTLVAAALFGSSFLAIPGLVIGRLGKLAGNRKDAAIGIATIIFGVAMIFGPAVGGLWAKQSGSFDGSLLLAGGTLLLVAAIAILSEKTTQRACAKNAAATPKKTEAGASCTIC